FTCPSDLNQDKKTPFPFTQAGVTSYGFNNGDWFVWNGFSSIENRGAFGPNRSRRISEFVDGTSQTLMATDVKAYQPFRRCNQQLANINTPSPVPEPTADPFTVAPEYGSAACGLGMAHSSWADGNTHETSMTTAWPPNKAIIDPISMSDLDLETRLIV